MRYIDFIYCSIYDWYERMKLNGRKVEPVGMVGAIITISVLAWGHVVYYLFLKGNKANSISLTSFSVINFVVAILMSGLLGVYYDRNDRRSRVYQKYNSRYMLKEKNRNIRMSFAILMFPWVILLFLGLRLIILHGI